MIKWYIINYNDLDNNTIDTAFDFGILGGTGSSNYLETNPVNDIDYFKFTITDPLQNSDGTAEVNDRFIKVLNKYYTPVVDSATMIVPYLETFESGSEWENKWINNTDSGGDITWSYGNTTPSGSTGPTGGIGGEGTYFLFVESSAPNNPNKKAIIESLSFTPLNNYFISFSYHLYGSNEGSLKLEVFHNEEWVQLYNIPPGGGGI